MHTKKGFTLIELLIVFAILFLIAGFVFPIVKAAKDRVSHKAVPAQSGAPSGDPTQSPLPPPVNAQVQVNTFSFQVNDPAVVSQIQVLLRANGYKVEPVTDKINLVYKPQ